MPVDLAPLMQRLAALELWQGEQQNFVTPPVVPVTPTLPTGYRLVRDHTIDMALGHDWARFQIYLLNWQQEPTSMGDPTLITWNNDGSATLDAGNTAGVWKTGALQLVGPKRRSAALVRSSTRPIRTQSARSSAMTARARRSISNWPGRTAPPGGRQRYTCPKRAAACRASANASLIAHPSPRRRKSWNTIFRRIAASFTATVSASRRSDLRTWTIPPPGIRPHHWRFTGRGRRTQAGPDGPIPAVARR